MVVVGITWTVVQAVVSSFLWDKGVAGFARSETSRGISWETSPKSLTSSFCLLPVEISSPEAGELFLPVSALLEGATEASAVAMPDERGNSTMDISLWMPSGATLCLLMRCSSRGPAPEHSCLHSGHKMHFTASAADLAAPAGEDGDPWLLC